MSHIRAEIILDKTTDVVRFVQEMNKENDTFVVENEDCSLTVDAKSYLGMLYASGDMKGRIYLVNKTNDGSFPGWTLTYRPMNGNL